MAPKAAQEKAKKKAAKQKKILMVLALPMLGAGVYAYMTMSSLSAKPQQVTATPAAASTPAATSTPAAAAPTGETLDAVITPGIAAVPISALRSFTALGRKDPFHDKGPKAGSETKPTDGSGSSDTGKGKGKGKGDANGGGSTVTLPPRTLTGAVISINGKKIALAVGTEFGHAPGLSGVPLFRLVKVTPKTALIGVVGTKQQFTLHVNKPLTLQQTGGWTYTLILQPIGSAAPMTVQQQPIHDQQTP